MKKLRKVLLVTLIGGMMLAAGCGKNKNTNAIDKNAIYREDAVQVKVEGINDYSQVVGKGTDLYIIGNTYDEKTYESTQYLITYNVDTKETNKIKVDFSVGDQVNTETAHTSGWINRILPVDDGLIVLYDQYFSDESDPDNYIWEENFYLHKVDKSGKVLKTFNLSEKTGLSYIDNAYQVPGGIIVFAENKFLLLDENLELKQERESSISWISDIFSDRSGQFYISYYGDENYEIHKLNPATLEIGDIVTFPFSVSSYSLMNAAGEYDFMFEGNNCVYGYRMGDADLTAVFNLIDSDVETEWYTCLYQNDDGTFVGASYNYTDTGSELYVSRFTKVAPEDVVEKKVLTLGCLYLDSDVRKEVVKFNKTNPDYRITIKDYNQYNTEEDYDAGQKKFNSDVASGQAPDIIISSNATMMANLRSKGLFINLYKYMDEDPDIDKSDIFPSILKACEYDGKLYEIVPSFYVETLVAKTSKVGNRASWTFDEMLEYEKTLPEGTSLFGSMTREEFLSSCVSINSDDYIDRAKGRVYFDTDEFKSVLTYSKSLPEGNDDYYNNIDYNSQSSLWRTDKAVLYYADIYSLEMYNQIVGGYFDEPVTFVGFPCKEGNGGGISYYNSVALSSKCSEPEVAWNFIKRYYTEEYQSTIEWGIPASMKQFDKLLAKQMERPYWENPETGEKEYHDNYFWMGETSITIDPLTQEQADAIKNYIMGLSKCVNYMDEDLSDIISEEAAPFYEGQKTVDEVTPIIQSRISIYVNEKQ